VIINMIGRRGDRVMGGWGDRKKYKEIED